MQMSDFATGRGLNVMERALHRAATRDAKTADMMASVAARAVPLDRIMRPTRVARALAVAAVSR
jgi:menaquinone-9 beta-reductase